MGSFFVCVCVDVSACESDLSSLPRMVCAGRSSGSGQRGSLPNMLRNTFLS